jgi:hypothetical protein
MDLTHACALLATIVLEDCQEQHLWSLPCVFRFKPFIE